MLDVLGLVLVLVPGNFGINMRALNEEVRKCFKLWGPHCQDANAVKTSFDRHDGAKRTALPAGTDFFLAAAAGVPGASQRGPIQFSAISTHVVTHKQRRPKPHMHRVYNQMHKYYVAIQARVDSTLLLPKMHINKDIAFVLTV